MRSRVSADVKERAVEALGRSGLTLSDAIQSFLLAVAQRGEMPKEVLAGRAATLAAIRELRSGGGRTAATVDEMMDQIEREMDAEDAAERAAGEVFAALKQFNDAQASVQRTLGHAMAMLQGLMNQREQQLDEKAGKTRGGRKRPAAKADRLVGTFHR